MIDAWKAQVKELAGRLENQIMNLVAQAPWDIPAVLSSRPHLDEEAAIRSTRYEMIASISSLIFASAQAFRDSRLIQPSTGPILDRFPPDHAEALEAILMTRMKTPLTILDQTRLRKLIITVLGTAAEFVMYFGGEMGKLFHWVHSDKPDQYNISNDVRLKSNSGSPTWKSPRIPFGAVLYIGGDQPAATAYLSSPIQAYITLAFHLLNLPNFYGNIFFSPSSLQPSKMSMASTTSSDAIDAVCAVCGKDEFLKRCAKCSTTYYCSRDCQKSDWKFHKKICATQASAVAEQDPPPRRERLCKGGVVTKVCSALSMIRKEPKKWFRNTCMDERDCALMFADQLGWMKYDKSSYVRKIVS